MSITDKPLFAHELTKTGPVSGVSPFRAPEKDGPGNLAVAGALTRHLVYGVADQIS
jgi:hypothetical protein